MLDTSKYHRLSDVDLKHKTATCSQCGHTAIVMRSGSWSCKTKLIADRKRWPSSHYQSRNRPTGPCEICGKVGRLVWDHDHETGQFRGWLCNSCNMALGLLGDNKQSIERVIVYLSK